MGRWLSRLQNDKSPETDATKPTKPLVDGESSGFVGFVAYALAPFQKNGAVDSVTVKPEAAAANDAPASANEPVMDIDRWCWPRSKAMTAAEIDSFAARLAWFTGKGLSYVDAERLADTLVVRDREGDTLRLCLECVHLQGSGGWRCSNWRVAQVTAERLPLNLVLMLQRCPSYYSALQRAPQINL